MKFFALVFLFGLASASLLEIYPDSDEEDFLLKTEKHKNKDELKTELGKELRAELDRILKHIKEIVDDGKEVDQKLLDECRDLVHKLKSYGEDVSEEAKDLLNYLKTRIQRWVDGLLDILRDGDSTTVHYADNSVKTEMGKKMQEFFDHILNRIKQSIDEGKHISADILNKVKEMAQKLKDYGVHVSDGAKTLLEELKSKYNEWAKELLDIIHGKNTTVQKSEDLKTELARKLRNRFERLLKRMNQTLEEGKHVSGFLIRQAKYFARKLKKYGLEVSNEVKDMLPYIKARASRWVDELMDIIRGDNSTISYSEPEVKTELAKKLREEFEHIVKKIKKLVQEGKHVSEKLWNEAKDLATKLRDYGMNVKDEIVDMLEFLKERYHNWVQHLIDILRGKKETL